MFFNDCVEQITVGFSIWVIEEISYKIITHVVEKFYSCYIGQKLFVLFLNKYFLSYVSLQPSLNQNQTHRPELRINYVILICRYWALTVLWAVSAIMKFLYFLSWLSAPSNLFVDFPWSDFCWLWFFSFKSFSFSTASMALYWWIDGILNFDWNAAYQVCSYLPRTVPIVNEEIVDQPFSSTLIEINLFKRFLNVSIWNNIPSIQNSITKIFVRLCFHFSWHPGFAW